MDVQSELSQSLNESRKGGCILDWFQSEPRFQFRLVYRQKIKRAVYEGESWFSTSAAPKGTCKIVWFDQ